MSKYLTEAVLYNSCGMEIGREILDNDSLEDSLASIFSTKTWIVNEGDTVKIETSILD